VSAGAVATVTSWHLRAPGSTHSAWPQANDLHHDPRTRKLTATEAKAKILALLDDVSAGDEVEITKHGRTVARLVPAAGSYALRGSLTGVAMSAAEDPDLFTTEEAWELA
jgi:prevent-host-death family protein